MGKRSGAYRVFVWKNDEKRLLPRLDVERRVILKWTAKK
jgi:hypothetical protein